MGEVSDKVNSVRKRWNRAGVLGREIEMSEITSLERRIGSIPPSYKEFLLEVGRQDDDDEDGFFFWAPEAVSPVNVLFTENDIETCPVLEEAVVIADYLQESWYYVLWTQGPRTGQVGLATGKDDEKRKPIGNLLAFLESYLVDSKALYPIETDTPAGG